MYINDIETKYFMQSENNMKIDSLLFVASTIKRRLLVPKKKKLSKEDDLYLIEKLNIRKLIAVVAQKKEKNAATKKSDSVKSKQRASPAKNMLVIFRLIAIILWML